MTKIFHVILLAFIIFFPFLLMEDIFHRIIFRFTICIFYLIFIIFIQMKNMGTIVGNLDTRLAKIEKLINE